MISGRLPTIINIVLVIIISMRSGLLCEQVSLRVMLLTSSYAFVHVTEPTRYKADYIPSNVAPLFYHYSVIMQHLLSDSLFSLISRENLQSNYTTETFEMSVIFQSRSICVILINADECPYITLHGVNPITYGNIEDKLL